MKHNARDRSSEDAVEWNYTGCEEIRRASRSTLQVATD